MFDSHPDLAVVQEARFVAKMGRHWRRYETPEGLDADRFVADVFSIAKSSHALALDREEVSHALAAAAPSSFAEAVRQVFALYAAGRSKTRYGDKTPGYVVCLPLLARLFPEGRFVHVIRDGRNSALSYLDHGYGPRTVMQAAFRWRNRLLAGRRAGRRLGPERYQELRYESLTDNPEGALRPVCDFLQLDFDEKMLRYFERADELVAGTAHPLRFQGLYRPPTAGLRDWRTAMSRDDVVLFDAIAGDVLEELGYERLPASRTLAVRLKVATGWVQWRQAEAVSSIRRGGERAARAARRAPSRTPV
jgi:hypothetical protein